MKLGKFRKGQMAVVMTLAIATLLGVMAIGTDVGVMYYNWGQLQKGADAASLAGASYLNEGITGVTFANANGNCSGDDAHKAACTYAINNGLASDADSLTINENVAVGPTPNLQVIVNRSNLPFMFGRVIGLSIYKVAAVATAAQPPAGGAHIFPIGIQCTPTGLGMNSCADPLTQWQPVPLTLKFIGDTFSPGNWDYLSPGQPGANALGDEMGSITGSSDVVNYLGTVQTKTGDPRSQNMVTGFSVRVTAHNNMTGTVSGSTKTCSSVSYTDVCSGSHVAPCVGDPLAVIVPLVNFNGISGSKPITVYGFAELYLNSAWNPKKDSTVGACFISTYDPNAVNGVAGAPANGVLPPVALIQ